jgi:class 3 adenylate cyclase
VTFLFTDVEGSTRAWEKSPELMARALTQHDEAIRTAVSAHNGTPVKARGEGDSWFIVFPSPVDAIAGAADIQRNLANVDWVTSPGLVVRASLHTGTADLRLGDYYGPTVNRAARLRSIVHGGQTIVSGATYQLVQDQLPEGVSLVDMGEHGLKDLTRPEHVYQVDVDGLPSNFPPLLSMNTVPNNLPLQMTDFVGRERGLEDVKTLLHDNRLVTILAAGGSGKTRLAIQAAADVTSNYPDGVFSSGSPTSRRAGTSFRCWPRRSVSASQARPTARPS